MTVPADPPFNPALIDQATAALGQTTLADLLARLEHQLVEIRTALAGDAVIPAQTALEDSLLTVVALLQRQQIDPQAALQRSVHRLNRPVDQQRTLRVYPDRAEWWVGTEYRGGWPLYSQEDWRSCQRLASELGCQLDVSDELVQQLHLFPLSAESIAQP